MKISKFENLKNEILNLMLNFTDLLVRHAALQSFPHD